MSSNTKRKRAVVLALIAFFCTAATTYVAVDWKRFGGGFLAFLRGKGDSQLASTSSGVGTGGTGVHVAQADSASRDGASLPRLVATNSRRHTADASHGAGGGHKSDEDLFKYGDPAAGGIPPGSFIVAQNDATGGGEGPAPAPASPQITSPAPAPETGNAAPGGSNGGLNDIGLGNKPAGTPTVGTPTPPPSTTPPASPTPPAASPPPAEDPPATPPPPSQSGTTDPGTTPPPPSLPPVSAVPESSTTAMMALSALFLAAAAARQRKNS